jgi:oxygen-dependent protoporphyrinogen oxidase
MTHDALVVGGGITGLATAHALVTGASRPLRIALIEAAPRLGGVIFTERTHGFLFDRGPDSFVAQKPEGRALCESLGLGGDLITPSARQVYVHARGRLRAMPKGMMLGVPTSIPSFLASDFVSWRGKMRMAMDLVMPRGKPGEESIASFIGRRFGQEAVEVIAEPLMAGIHSGRADQLSMAANFPQFVEMERKHRSVIVALRKAAGRMKGERTSPFLSLRGGMGDLIDALAAKLPEGSVVLGRRAKQLRRRAGGYAVALDDGTELAAPVVTLAIRSHHAAEMVEGELPDLANALAEISFVSSVVVFLGFERGQVRHPLDASGFVTRPGEGRVMAATFVSSKFEGRAPEGRVLLRAFLGGARDEEVIRWPDEELVEQAQAELGRLLEIEGEPIFTRVYRYERATPQLRLGHTERVAKLREREKEHEGLYVAGGGYEGIGIPECIRQGRVVAERALGRLGAG